MNYMNEIFTRADIQQIREFLLYGAEENSLDPRPYKERIESACKALLARLREEYEEITELFFDSVVPA